MEKRFELIKADVPSPTGAIYPTEALVQMMDAINTGNILATLDSNDLLAVPLERVVGTVHDAEIEDGLLSATLYIGETPCGNIVKEMIDDECGVALTIAGSANVSPERVISDYRLVYCFVTTVAAKGQ
jgi:hypothetical protein